VCHQNSVERLIVHTTYRDDQPRLHLVVTAAGPDVGLNLHVTGLRRELAFVPIGSEETVTLDLAVAGLPRWAPHQDNALEPIEVRLLRGGEAVWEATRLLAMPDVVWNDHTAAFSTNGQVLRDMQQLVTVPTEEQLTQFDARGTPIIQVVPHRWADEVCARLAHHPSIVAWAAPAGESPEISPEGKSEAMAMTYGRPWVRIDSLRTTVADGPR
jgi:hypothetical protein